MQNTIRPRRPFIKQLKKRNLFRILILLGFYLGPYALLRIAHVITHYWDCAAGDYVNVSMAKGTVAWLLNVFFWPVMQVEAVLHGLLITQYRVWGHTPPHPLRIACCALILSLAFTFAYLYCYGLPYLELRRRRRRGRCAACAYACLRVGVALFGCSDYDLRGQLEPRCPECGTPFRMRPRHPQTTPA